MSFMEHQSSDAIDVNKSSRPGSQPAGAPKRRHSESDLEVLLHREKKGSSVQHEVPGGNSDPFASPKTLGGGLQHGGAGQQPKSAHKVDARVPRAATGLEGSMMDQDPATKSDLGSVGKQQANISEPVQVTPMAPEKGQGEALATTYVNSAKKMALRTGLKVLSKARDLLKRQGFDKMDRHRLYSRAMATSFYSRTFGVTVSGASYGNELRFTVKGAPALAEEGGLLYEAHGASAGLNAPSSPSPTLVVTPAYEDMLSQMAAGKPVDDSSWQAAAEAGALKEDPAIQCVFPSCSLPAGYHLPGHPLGQISPACSDPTHSAAVASSPLLEILSEIDSYEDLQVVEREGQITALIKATGDAPMTASELEEGPHEADLSTQPFNSLPEAFRVNYNRIQRGAGLRESDYVTNLKLQWELKAGDARAQALAGNDQVPPRFAAAAMESFTELLVAVEMIAARLQQPVLPVTAAMQAAGQQHPFPQYATFSPEFMGDGGGGHEFGDSSGGDSAGSPPNEPDIEVKLEEEEQGEPAIDVDQSLSPVDGSHKFTSSKSFLVDDPSLDRHERQCDALARKFTARSSDYAMGDDVYVHDLYVDATSALAPIVGDRHFDMAVRKFLRYRMVIPAAMSKEDRLQFLEEIRLRARRLDLSKDLVGGEWQLVLIVRSDGPHQQVHTLKGHQAEAYISPAARRADGLLDPSFFGVLARVHFMRREVMHRGHPVARIEVLGSCARTCRGRDGVGFTCPTLTAYEGSEATILTFSDGETVSGYDEEGAWRRYLSSRQYWEVTVDDEASNGLQLEVPSGVLACKLTVVLAHTHPRNYQVCVDGQEVRVPHLLWWAGSVPPVTGQAVLIRPPERLVHVRLDSGESVVLKESEITAKPASNPQAGRAGGGSSEPPPPPADQPNPKAPTDAVEAVANVMGQHLQGAMTKLAEVADKMGEAAGKDKEYRSRPKPMKLESAQHVFKLWKSEMPYDDGRFTVTVQNLQAGVAHVEYWRLATERYVDPDILGDDALVHLKGKLIFLLHQNVLSGTSMAKDSVKLQKSQQFACAQKLAVKGEVVVTEKDVPARWIRAGRYPSNSPIGDITCDGWLGLYFWFLLQLLRDRLGDDQVRLRHSLRKLESERLQGPKHKRRGDLDVLQLIENDEEEERKGGVYDVNLAGTMRLASSSASDDMADLLDRAAENRKTMLWVGYDDVRPAAD